MVVIAGSYFLLKMKLIVFRSKESGVALCFGVSLLLPKAMYSCPFRLDILILLVDDPKEALINRVNAVYKPLICVDEDTAQCLHLQVGFCSATAE